MGRTIMISGPHAIGKSHTAKSLAYELGYASIGSTAGFVAEKMHYKFGEALPLEIAEYQGQVAKAFEFVMEATKECDTVFDRSPLDFATYLTMELGKTPDFDTVIKSYQEYCVELTKKYCDVLILPMADYSESYDIKAGRPAFNMEQVNYRQSYADLLEYFVEQLPKDNIKVITVPIDKQYGQRVNYLLARLKYG
jgi:hypothetical protein